MNVFTCREELKHASFPMERPSPKGFPIICLEAPLLNLTNPLKSMPASGLAVPLLFTRSQSGLRSHSTCNCLGHSSSLLPLRLGRQPLSILPHSAPSNAPKPSILGQTCSHKSKRSPLNSS